MSATYRGLEGLDDDLRRQREHVLGRSPSYDRALALLPEVLAGPPGGWVEASWKGRTFHAWYDRPLLLLAAMRADALAEGPAHPLHAAFTGERPDPDAVDEDRLAAALAPDRHRAHAALRSRGVQTNETTRAVAWLWPAAIAGLGGPGRPLALADLGASAGLNLVADVLPNVWTDEAGAPLEVARDVDAVARLGLDVAPLDATDEDDARWLLACVWPGETVRERRLEEALEAFVGARTRVNAPVLVPVAARSMPARLDALSGTHLDVTVLAYQSLVRDYLAPEERAEYEAGMRAWIGAHPPGRAIWIELELAPEKGPETSTIQATVRAPGGEVRTLVLARCSHHPSRVVRDRASVEELARITAGGEPAAAHP